MHKKQIENLLNLSAEERVGYLIRHCAGFEEVWCLMVPDNNWVIIEDPDGDEVFPIWSHKELAELCAFDEHKEMGAKAVGMSIYSFIEDVIDSPDFEGIYYGVFFNLDRQGLVLEAKTLKAELERELEEHL